MIKDGNEDADDGERVSVCDFAAGARFGPADIRVVKGSSTKGTVFFDGFMHSSWENEKV